MKSRLSPFLSALRALVRSCCVLLACLCLVPSAAKAQTDAEWRTAREKLVAEDLLGAGVKNERVLKAMRETPRHEFVPTAQRPFAYLDMPLPIGHRQTISPPFIVASMTERLDPQPTDRVLEIGTGSGYQAAILSPLVKDVFTIEIVEPLGARAASTLRRLKYANIQTRIGDGYQGWPEAAPFDKIIVTCSPEDVPVPLVEQLREEGRLIVPLGERYQQMLVLFTKRKGQLVELEREPTFFVPMTGAAEESRKVLPDDARPTLVNGGFEEALPGEDRPRGWFYTRLGHVTPEQHAPGGRHALVFRNELAGRGSQAFQAFGVDGRAVGELEISVWVRGRDVRAAGDVNPQPMLYLTFFNEARGPCGQAALDPWSGTFAWQRETRRWKVPTAARGAILTIGLLGGTGELGLDELELQPKPR